MSDKEEIEQAEVTEPDDTDAAAAALTAAGDEVGALKLRLERAERTAKRERDARRTLELTSYKSELEKEFEYAEPELITGSSKQAMRASAERLHNAVLKTIERKGLKPATPPVEETPEQKAARQKQEWGAPPAVATESVSGEAPMDWSDLGRAALTGKGPDGQSMDRAAILREIATNGPRTVARPTISAVIRGRAETPAKT